MAVSADSSYPYDGQSVTEAQWRKFAKYIRGDGVIRYAGSELAVFGDSTGMQVKVPTGECWIQSQWGEFTTQKTLPIATAHATLGRRDLVILRNDFSNNRIELDVLTGTPNASPVYPTVTQNSSIWEIQIGEVVVDAAVVTIAASKVTARREFVDGAASWSVDSGFQQVANGTITKVDWDLELFPSSAIERSGGNGLNTFTFKRRGFWLAVGSLEWAAKVGAGHGGANATSGRRAVWVDKATVVSDDRIGYSDVAPNVAGNPTVQKLDGLIKVNSVGDQYCVYCFQDDASGSVLEITRGNGGAANYVSTRVQFWWLG